MPCDSTPRIFPTLMVNGAFSPGFNGSDAPGKMSGTLSPALKFWAPHTICRSPLPSLTRQSESLSAFGCLSFVMTCATTTPSNSPETFSTPSTSSPSIVSRSVNSSGDQSKSTYCLSQLSVTFISLDDFELELFQETRVVFVEEANVVNAVTNHGDAFDAEAERPASPDFRIVINILENLWMHHAAAGNFEP